MECEITCTLDKTHNLTMEIALYPAKIYNILFSVDDEIAVGKFYATVLIQDAFRRFAKKKFEMDRQEQVEEELANCMHLQAGLR